MNTNEMLIGGYTLDELKKIQTAVKKDANKIISDAIEAATKAMDEILSFEIRENEEELDPDGDGYDEALAEINANKAKVAVLAKTAYDNLSLASTVASISDVEYYLPYNTDWSDEGYYYKFEEAYIEDIKSLDDMMGLIEDMESQSRQWHQSNC